MVSLLKKSTSGTSNLEYLVRYVSIGAVVVAVDVTAFPGTRDVARVSCR